jgi:hypothetical protein
VDLLWKIPHWNEYFKVNLGWRSILFALAIRFCVTGGFFWFYLRIPQSQTWADAFLGYGRNRDSN